MKYREETDSLGKVHVPEDVYYGPQTQRAVENFPISGITANIDQCQNNIQNSLAIVTSLVPHIGYDRAAEIAKKAFDEGKTIEAVALEEKILSEQELKTILFRKFF